MSLPKRRSIGKAGILGFISHSECDDVKFTNERESFIRTITMEPNRTASPNSKTIKLFIDDLERFSEKSTKILNALKESNNTCIFLDVAENATRHFTPFFEEEKSGKYGDLFEPSIKLAWSIEKSSQKVKVTYSTGYVERNEQTRIKDPIEGILYQKKPQFTHLAMSALVKKDVFHSIVTTQTTNQLRSAGIPDEILVELHGNSFREECGSCKSYSVIRKYDVVMRNKGFSHCEKCGATLMSGFVRVGDKISDDALARSQHMSSTSRLSIVFDSAYKEV